MSKVWTFTAKMTGDQMQQFIDDNEGTIVLTVPWIHTRGYEDVSSGDGAVIEVSEDKSAWIADVLDVEFEVGYDMTVMLDVR